MPARTLPSVSDLIIHVPVDRFTIVNGPRLYRCMQIMEDLTHTVYVEQMFTLTTPASISTFRRTMRLATMFSVQPNGTFEFTALFYDRVISGVYAPRRRRGWFSLD